MADSIKQKKIGKLIQEELSKVFQKMGLNVYQGGMITITGVNITPDLLIARVSVSFLNIKDPKKTLQEITAQTKDLRHQLGNKIRNQVRVIPDLEFFLDDSLGNVFKIEEIFKKLNK
jgi:ribosome-binding factor A